MMIEPAKREESDGRNESPTARTPRVRTAGESSRRGSGSTRDAERRPSRPERSRGSGTGSGNSRSGGRGRGRRPAPVSSRPNAGKTSGGFVRILAPLALILFAIASFSVISNKDSGSNNAAAVKKTSTTKSVKTNGNGTATVTTRKTYTVKSGDSFAAIAEKLNIDVNTLSKLNSNVDPRALQPGQKLKLR